MNGGSLIGGITDAGLPEVLPSPRELHMRLPGLLPLP